METETVITTTGSLYHGLQDSYKRYTKSFANLLEVRKIIEHNLGKGQNQNYVQKVDDECWDRYTRHLQQYTFDSFSVYLFAASLLEAMINLYIYISFQKNITKKELRESPRNKWKEMPKRKDPNYELSEGNSPYEELNHLYEIRNSIVHSKPFLKQNDKTICEGYMPRDIYHGEELEQKIVKLPINMVEFLIKNEKVSNHFTFCMYLGFVPTEIINSTVKR